MANNTILENCVAISLLALDIALIGVGAPFMAGASVALVKGAWDNKEGIAEYGNKFLNLISGESSSKSNSKELELDKNQAIENNPHNNESEVQTVKAIENNPSDQNLSSNHHFTDIADPNHLHNQKSSEHKLKFTDIVDPNHLHNAKSSEQHFVKEVKEEEAKNHQEFQNPQL